MRQVNVAHPIDMAIKEMREYDFEHGLMDCEIRSIFNMGLIARNTLPLLAEQWMRDKEIRNQISGEYSGS